MLSARKVRLTARVLPRRENRRYGAGLKGALDRRLMTTEGEIVLPHDDDDGRRSRVRTRTGGN
jgi:hypothetical protein